MASMPIRLALAATVCLAVPGVAAVHPQEPTVPPTASGATGDWGRVESRRIGTASEDGEASPNQIRPIADTLFVEQPPGSGVYGVIAGRVTELNRQYIRIASDSGERLVVRKAARRVVLDFDGHYAYLVDSVRAGMGSDTAALRSFNSALSRYMMRTLSENLDEVLDAIDRTPIEQARRLITGRRPGESSEMEVIRQDTVLAALLWRLEELDEWNYTVDIAWNRDKSFIVSAVQNAPAVGGWFRFLDDVDPRVGAWLAALVIALGLLYVCYRGYKALAIRAFERQLADAKLLLDVARSRLELLDTQRKLGLPEDPPLAAEDTQMIRKAAAALHAPPPRWLQQARSASAYLSVPSSTERSRRQVLRVLQRTQERFGARAARALLGAWMLLNAMGLLAMWVSALSTFFIVLGTIPILAESPVEGLVMLGLFMVAVFLAFVGSRHLVAWLRMARQLSAGALTKDP